MRLVAAPRHVFKTVFVVLPDMSDLKESQALSNAKAEEYEVFQDDDEFEEFEEGTQKHICVNYITFTLLYAHQADSLVVRLG